jgi:hypothetical protein
MFLNNDYYAHLTDLACDGLTGVHSKEFSSAVSSAPSNATVMFDAQDGNRYLIVRNDLNEEINGVADYTLIGISLPCDSRVETDDSCDIIVFANFDTYAEALQEMCCITNTDAGF